jgi:uncharacterized membrane protein
MSASWVEGGAVRAVICGLVAAGIVHICAVFATPVVLGTGAYERLAEQLPANRLIVLRPASPQAQLIPYQDAHTYYALCQYDASKTPVASRASLPGAGWTFAIYSSAGDNFYVVPGQDQRQTDVNVLLVPAGDQASDFVPDAQTAAGAAVVPVPSPTGLIVVRAPVKAQGYRPDIEAHLARAACGPGGGAPPAGAGGGVRTR